MSEKYSALAQVTIDRSELIAYLDGTPRSTRHWDDWGALGERRYGGLARVDQWLGMGAYRYQIRRIFAKSISIGRFCRYEESTSTFTFGSFFFSEEPDDLALFFAVARGLSRYLHGRQWGYAAVDNVPWGQAPRAVMDIGPGRSRFLRPSEQGAYLERSRRASATFDVLTRVYASEDVAPIDHLDAVR
jgi:hypothetical protein